MDGLKGLAGPGCQLEPYPRAEDTLIPALGWGSERIKTMARKHYDDEFRRSAVDLYETTPGATVRSIAEDLGIERGTLRDWLDKFGTGRKTGHDGMATRSPLRRRSAGPADGAPADQTPEQELIRLREQVKHLQIDNTKLTTEREILRKAAKYFAGETNW